MIMTLSTCGLLEEMGQQLEKLDEQQATLQYQSYLAHVYARWCDATFAELGSRRSELEQIIREWQEVDQLYDPHGGVR
jgi:hypothetical protein